MRGVLLALLAAGTVRASGSLPLFFVPNVGQGPAGARFVAAGSGVTAAFSAAGVSFRTAAGEIRLTFEGANPRCRIVGRERLAARANFLRGDGIGGRTGVPLYGAVVYRDLYPGIDMVYGGNGRNFKSEFVVAPGADPGRIHIRYGGAVPYVGRDGALMLGVVRDEAPLAYQDGRPIGARYTLSADGSVGFWVDGYDAARPLTIDPVLVSSTVLGGSWSDAALALAVDSSGAMYVAGYTSSHDFPTANPAQNLNAGGNDVFVAKVNAAGTALVYCTYLGGTGDDRAYGIAVDGSGSAYVTGSTTSRNFPVHNAMQSKLGGFRNAFVVKLNAAGNALVFGTYLGGAGSDTAYGIAVDGSGNSYIVGDTNSATFPATGFQRNLRGSTDAFVSKLSADGSHLVYSTYLGGTAIDHASAVAVDGSGRAHLTGSTFSSDFPTANAFQVSNAGGQDVFVAKLSADGSGLVYSTYLGGSGGGVAFPESGQGIALDGAGNAYAAGMTSSANFPMIQPLQASLNGWGDAFAVKLNSSGTPVYSTYVGGSGLDQANAIAVDANGSAYVAGHTFSTDLAVVNATQANISWPGDLDAFVAIVEPGGASLSYLSYLGGRGSDTASSIAVDAGGSIYVAGWTMATDFPLLNPVQSVNGGGYGAFLLKMRQVGLGIACTHTGNFTQGQTGTYTVTVTNMATTSPTSGTVTVTDTLSAGLTLQSMAGTGWTCGGASCTRSDALGAGASYPAITVTVQVAAGAASPQQNTAMVSGGGDTSTHSSVDSTIIVAGATFTISGSVTLAGVGLAGVSMALSGAQTASATTNSSGQYSFAGLVGGGSYTVQPTGTSHVFTPTTQTIANLTSDGTANFTAEANLAQGKTATQKSTYGSYPASLAVDGNTDGVFAHGSVSAADYASSPWWQVDLGGSAAVSAVVIWGRTDCCATWLSDYWIFISDSPFGAADTPETLQSRPGTFASHQTTAPQPMSSITTSGAQGRYVRVQLSGTNFLEMAEVLVAGTWSTTPTGTNLAQGKSATQTSTYGTFVAGLAVDGDTNGVMDHGSLAITNYGASPWWEVDLGSSGTLTSVVVWARTDCCADWLSDYWVFVSDTPFGASDTPTTLQARAGTWSNHQTTAPAPASTITTGGAQGRYVRVQLSGSNFLELAEVEAIGTATTPPSGYAITGRVTLSGTGLPGVGVALSGTQSGSTTTDSSGNYSFASLGAGGNYTVTPTGTGYTFSPASQSFSNLTGNQTANFTASGGPTNLALGKAATQSETYSTYVAGLAVDGNTDGVLSRGSVTIANYRANPWWQVDLGAAAAVNSVVVWGRTDCCGFWLNDYWVFVSNTPFGDSDTPATLQGRAGTWSSHQTVAPDPSVAISAGGAQGRYVRVQLSGTNYLELAEVQVMGIWQ